MRALACLAGCCLVVAPLSVRAQSYSSTTVAERPEPAVQALGSSEQIEVDPEVAKLDADELLEAVPGAQVRSTGGPGAPAYLALRGSAPWQTLVLLDGVPVSGADALAVDLSALPLVLLDGIDVYRGQVPVQLGAAQPGGAVNLRFGFASSDRVALRTGGGSFGYRTASAAAQARGAVDWLAGLSYSGANADFAYFDDAGTRFEPADDGTRRRLNAGHDALSAVLRLRARPGRWRITTLGVGGWRAQGVPGIVTLPTTGLSTTAGWLQPSVVAASNLSDTVRVELLGSWRVRQLTVRDASGELPPGLQAGASWGHFGLLSVRPSITVGTRLTVEPLLEGAIESAVHPGGPARTRLGGAGGVEAVAELGEWALRAGVRSDLAADRSGADAASLDVSTNPSIGAAWRHATGVGAELGLRLSGGGASRLPGFVERFGSGASLVGDPDLRPEQRWGAEAGVWFAGERGVFAGSLDVAGYGRTANDLIVWVENGTGVSVAQNLDRARIAGLEVAAQLDVGRWAGVTATYAWIDAVDTGPDASSNGEHVPWVVPHQLSASLTGGVDAVVVRLGLTYAGAFAIDRLGQRPLPARTTVDAGVRLAEPWLERFVLDAAVSNLLDARVQSVYLPDGGRLRAVPQAISDYSGYPLPGRAFYVSLSYTHTLP